MSYMTFFLINQKITNNKDRKNLNQQPIATYSKPFP